MSPDTITRMMAEETRLRLARCPETQAEAIAYHYARLAALAVNLQELVRQQRVFGYSENAAKIIGMITQDIQEAHLKDLGIPLEWKCDETLYRDRAINPQGVASSSNLRLDSWCEECRV